MRRLLTLTFIFCFVFALDSLGTHLMGGNLGYEYQGNFGGNSRYKITFYAYINCDASSQVPFPDNSIQIAVYNDDASSPNNPKSVFNIYTVSLTSSRLITPDAPNGCTVGNNVCVREGIYELFVDLPIGINGYHVYYQRCCRNGSIANLSLPGKAGMGFYAYIPPTITNNNSPSFADVPVPFICADDTVTVLNTAFDADGDQLVFSFENPYNGYATDLDPAAIPPSPMPWPMAEVTYASAHNKNVPFGPTGFASINAVNGLTKYYAPNVGNYVVAVEIKEYRNGKLIGVTRRDMQLLVMACPSNPAPNLSPTVNGGQTIFHIQEGENLCFDVQFDDANANDLLLIAKGDMFDTTKVNPAATITDSVASNTTVISQFCWDTRCGQSQALPYMFAVTATDDGCPPKSASAVYQIFVDPFVGPTYINGDSLVCKNELGVQYETESFSGGIYNWSVTGGSIASGQGTQLINVDWSTVDTGYVRVEVTLDTCVRAYEEMVLLSPVPVTGMISDTSKCSGDTIQLFALNDIDYSYQWTPSTGLSDDTIYNPDLTIINTDSISDTLVYFVEITNGQGCVSIDSVQVIIHPIPTVGTNGPVYLCPGTSDTIVVTSNVIGSIVWTPSTGLSDTTSFTPIVSVVTDSKYYFSVSSGAGCSVEDSIEVIVNQLVPTDAGPDTMICIGDTIQIGGNPTAPSGSLYSWSPSGSLDASNVANPYAFPNITTSYIVTTSNDTCTGADTMILTVNNLPNVDAGLDTALCIGDTIQLIASGALNYNWTPNIEIVSDSIFDPIVFNTISRYYYLSASDTNGCVNDDSVYVLVRDLPVNPTTDTSYTVCFGESVQLLVGGGDSYLWTPNDFLDFDTINNPISSPDSTIEYHILITDQYGCELLDTTTVFVNELPDVSLTSDFIGCIGDSVWMYSGGGLTYNWSPSTHLNNTNDSTVHVLIENDIIYQVIVADGNGCVDSAEVSIVVEEPPLSLFTVDYLPMCDGVEAKFINNSTNATSAIWTIDGVQFTTTDVTVLFDYDQLHSVTLQVTNNVCSDTLSNTLPIDKMVKHVLVDYNDVLTINNDGLNDELEYSITGGVFDDCTSIVVYNRWGLEVFNSNSHTGFFDGINETNGQQLEAGTYYFILSVGELSLKKYVTIIR